MAKGERNISFTYVSTSIVWRNFYNRLLSYRVVELVPEESEDMWHVYNLITVGDNVRASTVR